MRIIFTKKCAVTNHCAVATNLNIIKPSILLTGTMLLPSEIEAKSLIPAVRSILAKKLIKEYELKEEEVAKVLGVTQAAVSNYVRGTRGDVELISKLGSVQEVMRMIDDIARDLASYKAYTPSTMAKFVELCNYMRYSFIICDVHHTMESNIDEQICEQCKVTLTSGRI
jgi:predicted transcriptional regulator